MCYPIKIRLIISSTGMSSIVPLHPVPGQVEVHHEQQDVEGQSLLSN